MFSNTQLLSTVILLGAFWAIFNLMLPSVYGAWLSVAFFTIYMLVNIVVNRSFFLLIVFAWYYFLFLILGTASVESGVYMLEIAEWGSPNGSTALVLFFCILFINCLRASWHFFSLQFERTYIPSFNVKLERTFGVLVCFIIILFCCFLIYRYSSPILLGIERSTFKAHFAPSWYTGLYSVFWQSFIIITLLWFFTDGIKKGVFSLFVLIYFSIMFLVFGEKFTGLILLLFSLLAVYGAQGRSFNLWAIITLASCGLIIFSLVFYSYFLIGREPLEFILLRVALQGQLIWSLVSDPSIDLVHSVDWGCIVGSCTGGESLADAISKKYLPTDQYFHYLEAGNALSGFMPATHIFAFGLPTALVLCILFATIYGAAAAFFATAVRSRNLFMSVLAYKLFFSVGMIYFTRPGAILQSAIFWLGICGLCLLLLLSHIFGNKEQVLHTE